jgi:hypothetical protein
VKRRSFLQNIMGLTALGISSDLLTSPALAGNRITPKNIVIRTSWSPDELGARLYMPAAFKMVQRNIPGAVITFWPYYEDEAAMDKVKLNVTQFMLLKGDLEHVEPSSDLIEELKKTDLLIHFGGTIPASGNADRESNLLHSQKLFDFCRENKIQYALHSLKFPEGMQPDPETINILNNASAVFTSYSVDHKSLESSGIINKKIEFAPDAAYYFEFTDEIKAGQYLTSASLNGKPFLAIGLRRNNVLGQGLDLDQFIPQYSEVINKWVSETGNPVLVISGDMNDRDYLQKNLISSLPKTTQDKTVFLDNTGDPSTIISIIDKARISIGNDPYVIMMSVSSKVPVIFTTTFTEDRTFEIFQNTELEERIIDLTTSQSPDLLNLLLSMNKNYVDELILIDKVSKLLAQAEKKSFKTIDKALGIKETKSNNRRPNRGYMPHQGESGEYHHRAGDPHDNQY